MAKNSPIEWTHHTFNPWWGCVRVSDACKNCYAETWAKRLGFSIWGPKSSRKLFGDAHWKEPLRWNREAEFAGERRRVFCASMADVFENRRDLDGARLKLWDLISATPHLDWLLLTKRPQFISKFVPWKADWPKNVWCGVTAENQKWANRRIPVLMDLPAVVRFLSCEPLLGRIDLGRWTIGDQRINWVIAGGESGHKARPMNPDWARYLRDQCTEARIPFHFKQWGHWAPSESESSKVVTIHVKDSRGQTISLAKLGKHASGRLLDGATWEDFPNPTR